MIGTHLSLSHCVVTMCNLPIPQHPYLSPVCPLLPFDTHTTVDDHKADIVNHLRDEAPDEPPTGPEEVVCKQSGILEQTIYVADSPLGEQFTQMPDFLNGGSEHSLTQTGV